MNLIEKKRNPYAAFLLSLIVCGQGQLYNGSYKKGLVFYFSSLISATILILSGVFFSFGGGIAVIAIPFLVTAASAVEAFVFAWKNKVVQLNWYNHVVVYFFTVITGLLLTSVVIDVVYSRIMHGYNTIMPTRSMEPAILRGDRLLCSLNGPNAARGDVVIVRIADRVQIKRLIALEGDDFKIENNKVMLNRDFINEPYATGETYYRVKGRIDGVVPKGFCVVLCDNREKGFDSRDAGYINIQSVLGRVRYTYLSVNRNNIGKSFDGKKIKKEQDT